MSRFLGSILLVGALLISTLQANGVSIRASGGDDTAAIQSALRKHKIVFLPDPKYMVSNTISIPSFRTLYGSGMYQTSVEADMNKPMLNVQDKTNVTIRDIGLTYNADPKHYNTRGHGGYVIDSGPGRGSQSKSAWVTIDRVWIHDTHTAGIATYSGTSHWDVRNCRIERTGRGACTGNGWRWCNFVNNYIGETGDDGIALNAFAVSCTVDGNVFYRCGALGVTPASGIKCHGQGISITGNVFWQNHTSIAMQSASGMSYPQGWRNLQGACRDSVISGNSIYSIAEGFNGSNPRGIRLHSCEGLVVSNNTIMGLDPSGLFRPFLELQHCDNISFQGNRFVGSFAHIASSRVRFLNDSFCCIRRGQDIRDNAAVRLLYGGKKFPEGNDVDFDYCRFNESIGCLVSNESNHTAHITVNHCGLENNRRIGWLPEHAPVSIGDTQVQLDTYQHPEYRGITMSLLKQDRLILADRDKQEMVTVLGDFPMPTRGGKQGEGQTIRISPAKHSFLGRDSWVEWSSLPAVGSVTAAYVSAGPGKKTVLRATNNDLPRFASIVGGGKLTASAPTLVADLPDPMGHHGDFMVVDDGAAGAPVLAFCDGKAWLRSDNGKPVSSE